MVKLSGSLVKQSFHIRFLNINILVFAVYEPNILHSLNIYYQNSENLIIVLYFAFYFIYETGFTFMTVIDVMQIFLWDTTST